MIALIIFITLCFTLNTVCACPSVYAPVCAGSTTFANECIARRYRAKIDCEQECPCDGPSFYCKLVCPWQSDPVCAGSTTFHNECVAQCLEKKIDCKGSCPCPKAPSEICFCPLIFHAVCAANKTYSSECVAKCHNATIDCHNRCPCGEGKNLPDKKDKKEHRKNNVCLCPKIYHPVCAGSTTFSTECAAHCKGAKIDCYQGCPCP